MGGTGENADFCPSLIPKSSTPRSARPHARRGNLQNSWAVPSGNTLTPLFGAYTEITALVKFVEMNGEGFRKIVKKYDKTMGTDFLDRYLCVYPHMPVCVCTSSSENCNLKGTQLIWLA